MAVPANLYHNEWSKIDEDDKVTLFTWNPKPRFYAYDKYEENDYNRQWLTMCKKLTNLNRCSVNYAIVAEISDSGKLHCHGFIVIKDKVKWCKSVLPSFIRGGFVKHAKASSHKWNVFEYHLKEIDITPSFISPNIPFVLTPQSRDDILKEIRSTEMKACLTKASKIVNKNLLTMFEQLIDK